jgi:hypothetical protein
VTTLEARCLLHPDWAVCQVHKLAGIITEAVTVIAETDGDAVHQRTVDGYILKENIFTDLSSCVNRMQLARETERSSP